MINNEDEKAETLNNLSDEKINEVKPKHDTADEVIEEIEKVLINDDEKANDSNETLEISDKLKTRKNYIDAIKELCLKMGRDPPKGLHQKKKEELKKILAGVCSVGAVDAQGFDDSKDKKTQIADDIKESYVVGSLYAFNKCFLGAVEQISYSYKEHLGGRYCKDLIKKLEENQRQKEELKRALVAIYHEYKEDLDTYISPVTSLLLINFSIIIQSLHIDIDEQANKRVET